MKDLKMIPCPKCGEDFPELRKTEYGYHVCVNCSTTEAVVGITTVEGSGDHTYNDLIIMDGARARAIAQREAELRGQKVEIEVLNLDVDESAVSQSIKEEVDKTLNEDFDQPLNQFDPDAKFEGIKGIDY